MKRRIFSLVIVMVLCLVLAGNTLALSSDDVVVQPRAAIVVTCGLTAVGGQYKAWARTEAAFTDTLTARVVLYRVVNGSLTFVTSANASTTGTSVTASKTQTLTSGTYRVYGYGTSSTASGSTSTTVTVP
ncbi:MAG: hypothetical protein GX417_07535 [Clostridiales bacterium]|nr:hypothetical protein [Clostridiales bacterium]